MKLCIIFTEWAHWANSVSKVLCPSVCVLCVPLFEFLVHVLLLQFTKFKSQVNKLQKKVSIGKSDETTLFNNLAILA